MPNMWGQIQELGRVYNQQRKVALAMRPQIPKLM
jgi:hypothetical protein